MEYVVRRAIESRQVVEVIHKGMRRVVEPYLLFESSKGDLVLHSWQIGGEYDETPPPDWCNMRISDISGIRDTGTAYSRPHPKYRRASRQFHRVLCCA